MPERVAILGGGVAGFSAAHELMERGFEVSVYEMKDVPGGKARSIPAPHTGALRNVGTVHVGRIGSDRRSNLPGEHGFRFFPRFYRHVVDTMRRIPFRNGLNVADNLIDTHKVLVTRSGRRAIELPARFPRALDDLKMLLGDAAVLFGPELGLTMDEKLHFFERIWQILTSCEERRLQEYEKIAWWDFVGAAQRSLDYQRFFALGITRSLVAAKAETASTRTIGDIFVQLLCDIAEPGVSSDRVLNGPTSEVWIEPWLHYLRAHGVTYHFNSRVRSLHVKHGRISHAIVEQRRRPVAVHADYYIAAMPVEVMAGLVTPELIAAAPELDNIIPLSRNTEWMNGIQLYFTEDVPIVRGHVLCVDSPWALTAISQRQFWPAYDPARYGNGRVRGIISVDISSWDTPGFSGKSARECTRDEIQREVWEQLKASLNVEGQDLLKDEELYDYFLDPAIDPRTHSNGEPLLVNLVDTWRLRPEATTTIPNLFLASDYVRTYTDLATMEGANEAARRAANGILQRSGSKAPPCQLWRLLEPAILEPMRIHDRQRFERGLPWDERWSQAALILFHVVHRLVPTLGHDPLNWQHVLAVLGQRFPEIRLLQFPPDVSARLARGEYVELLPFLAQLAPVLAEHIGELPAIVAALRHAIRSSAARAPGGSSVTAGESNPMARGEEPASAPADANTPAGSNSGGVRMVQR